MAIKGGKVVKKPEAGSCLIPQMGPSKWIREPSKRSLSWPIAQTAQPKSAALQFPVRFFRASWIMPEKLSGGFGRFL